MLEGHTQTGQSPANASPSAIEREKQQEQLRHRNPELLDVRILSDYILWTPACFCNIEVIDAALFV